MKRSFIIVSLVLVAIVIGVYCKRMLLDKNTEDRTELYIKGVTDEDIIVSEDTTTVYVDSQILVNLREGHSKKELEKLLKEEGGTIVGEIPMSGTYQVEFSEGKSQDELEEIISVLEQKECVEQAIIHYASLGESESFGYANESWSPTEGEPNKPFEENGTRWDVLYPDGPNWWAEAIWLPGIDDIDVEFSAVNVGIVDSMFDTAHPDLKKAFVEEPYQNPEKLDATCSDYKHGTHVSGIIGARINNEGIAGVAPNTRLYGFSLSGTKQHKYTALIEEEYAIATLLAKDVRIINYSWGTYALNHIVAHMLSMKKKNELTDNENSFLKNIEEKRNFFEIFFRRCEEQYDFLLFKAAGNANNLSIVRASEEDESNNDIRTCMGYRFYNSETDSSLKRDMIIKYDDVSCKDDIYYFDNEEIRQSILFVGAMDRIDFHGKFKPADYSCIDADILTPGNDILSDWPDGKYGFDSGTSMAAPIASGIAALVWGVKPDLSAVDVRDLLINAQRPFESVLEFAEVPLKNTSDFAMLNAFFAVNDALKEYGTSQQRSDVDGSKQEYAVLMGVLYEEKEGNPRIDLKSVTDITLTITDDKELYQKGAENLEDGGGFVFFIKPGTYRFTIGSSKYYDCNIEINAKPGEVIYKEIGLAKKQEPTDKDVVAALYDKAIADYDRMMIEGAKSFNEYSSDRNTYYAIVDIDNNGIDELILRYDFSNSDHLTNHDSGYGETTFVYTVTGGELIELITPLKGGYTPTFAHVSFVRIYKESNLINCGMQHSPEDEIFYQYQEGELSVEPVLSLTMGGIGEGTWIMNDEMKSREECTAAYNQACNNDEGYEMILYERDKSDQGANRENDFPGIITLNEGETREVQIIGESDQIKYMTGFSEANYSNINITVNERTKGFRLEGVLDPTVENVYVTDIDTTDSYGNIVVVIYGEDDESETYLYAFNSNETCELANFKGRLVPESITGSGTVFLTYSIGMSISGYGSFTVRPEISVHGLDAQQESLQSGKTVYSDEGFFYEEGFEVTITNAVTVYEDSSMSLEAGTIPAGSSVTCEFTEQYLPNEPYGEIFYVSYGEIGGYVTSRIFRESCDGVRFAG